MKKDAIINQDLNGGWLFKNNQNDSWFRANVPGNIHLDLHKNNLIPDPFFGQNEIKLQWISDRDWLYRMSFTPTKDILSKKNIELCFQGIDTYADVFLNDVKIIRADNMFHPWRVRVKDILKDEENEIVVHFRSALKEKLSVIESLGHSLPADNDQAGKTSPFTRKAPYHFGWDWGPCFVTSGLWKGVNLFGWDDWFVDRVSIVNNEVSEKSAKVLVELDISSGAEENLFVKVDESKTGQKVEHHSKIKPGNNKLEYFFIIKDPELWWPIGGGGGGGGGGGTWLSSTP
ncbi:MAG: glycosyl hydrolase 2 galactose-binding domain-containing protein [Candidatus Neomarinimicrobiota bacterium]